MAISTRPAPRYNYAFRIRVLSTLGFLDGSRVQLLTSELFRHQDRIRECVRKII
jgi:hypothetical protein